MLSKIFMAILFLQDMLIRIAILMEYNLGELEFSHLDFYALGHKLSWD